MEDSRQSNITSRGLVEWEFNLRRMFLRSWKILLIYKPRVNDLLYKLTLRTLICQKFFYLYRDLKKGCFISSFICSIYKMFVLCPINGIRKCTTKKIDFILSFFNFVWKNTGFQFFFNERILRIFAIDTKVIVHPSVPS